MKKGKPESKLQKACVKWFYDNIPNTQAFLFAVPNGGSRHKLEAYNLKLEGVRPGVADLELILAGGVTVFIELKHGNNGQSPEQKNFEEIAKNLGFNYYVVKNIKDFKAVVKWFVG